MRGVQRPFLWKHLGRFRHFLLTAYVIFGAIAGIAWLVLQIVLSHSTLTPAAEVFFFGFALLIALNVLGVFVVAIVTEDAAITAVEGLELLQERTNLHRAQRELQDISDVD